MAHRPTFLVVLVTVALMMASGWAGAQRQAPAAGPQLSGEALEREARVIDAMLIAPCCYSQQVSVHQSPAADEAKADIRARLSVGQDRQQILAAYVDQYGKRVLAEPPAVGFDLTLYIMPFVVLLGSMGVIALAVRRFTGRASRLGAAAGNGTTVPPEADLEAKLDDDLRDLD